MHKRTAIRALLSALIATLLIAACSQATPTVDPLIYTQTAAAQALRAANMTKAVARRVLIMVRTPEVGLL